MTTATAFLSPSMPTLAHIQSVSVHLELVEQSSAAIVETEPDMKQTPANEEIEITADANKELQKAELVLEKISKNLQQTKSVTDIDNSSFEKKVTEANKGNETGKDNKKLEFAKCKSTSEAVQEQKSSIDVTSMETDEKDNTSTEKYESPKHGSRSIKTKTPEVDTNSAFEKLKTMTEQMTTDASAIKIDTSSATEKLREPVTKEPEVLNRPIGIVLDQRSKSICHPSSNQSTTLVTADEKSDEDEIINVVDDTENTLTSSEMSADEGLVYKESASSIIRSALDDIRTPPDGRFKCHSAIKVYGLEDLSGSSPSSPTPGGTPDSPWHAPMESSGQEARSVRGDVVSSEVISKEEIIRCQQNLLNDVDRLEDEIEQRLDDIEEKVNLLQDEYLKVNKCRSLINDVCTDFHLPDMTSLIRTVDNIKWMFVAQEQLHQTRSTDIDRPDATVNIENNTPIAVNY